MQNIWLVVISLFIQVQEREDDIEASKTTEEVSKSIDSEEIKTEKCKEEVESQEIEVSAVNEDISVEGDQVEETDCEKNPQEYESTEVDISSELADSLVVPEEIIDTEEGPATVAKEDSASENIIGSDFTTETTAESTDVNEAKTIKPEKLKYINIFRGC